MRRVRVLMVLVLLGSLAGVGGISAQQAGGSQGAALTAQDYADIGQLYVRINHGGDFRDADLWLSAFADDAVFAIAMGPGQEFVGEGGPRRVAASEFPRAGRRQQGAPLGRPCAVDANWQGHRRGPVVLPRV